MNTITAVKQEHSETVNSTMVEMWSLD